MFKIDAKTIYLYLILLNFLDGLLFTRGKIGQTISSICFLNLYYLCFETQH